MALIRRANSASFSLDDTKIHRIAKESICLMQIRVQSLKYIHYSTVTPREIFLYKRSSGRHTYWQAVGQFIRLGIRYHGIRYSSPRVCQVENSNVFYGSKSFLQGWPTCQVKEKKSITCVKRKTILLL